MSNFYTTGGAAFSSERSEWETPPEIFARANEVWRFDLDAASSDENALCPDHYTKEQDGLAQSWEGRRVWCNPPYGRGIGAWVAKGHEEGAKPHTVVVMLLPARTDTAWFHDHIAGGKAAEVALIRGRLKFRMGGGNSKRRPLPVHARKMGRAFV